MDAWSSRSEEVLPNRTVVEIPHPDLKSSFLRADELKRVKEDARVGLVEDEGVFEGEGQQLWELAEYVGQGGVNGVQI
jgi:hypothetical protein